MIKFDHLFASPLSDITDADLDAISEWIAPITGCAITREGNNHHSLSWIRWVWTPDGYRPDPAGEVVHWPLASFTTVQNTLKLARHLVSLRP